MQYLDLVSYLPDDTPDTVQGWMCRPTHAVNVFKKLCGVEAYSPVDKCPTWSAIAQSTTGWDTIFSAWPR
jgi:D-sedoheptulose 7-phosphate isomerase